MGKDFGDDVLPVVYHDGYFKTSDWPGQALAHWYALLHTARYDLNDCIIKYGQPGWIAGGQTDAIHTVHYVILMYVPTTSIMSQRWAAGIEGQQDSSLNLVSPKNGTGPVTSE